MIDKALQKVESIDAGVNAIRGEFSSMSQLMDSHTTSIEKQRSTWRNYKPQSIRERMDNFQVIPFKILRRMDSLWKSPLELVKFFMTLFSAGIKHEKILQQAIYEEETMLVDDPEKVQHKV